MILKARAKLDNGEWVVGYPIKLGNALYILLPRAKESVESPSSSYGKFERSISDSNYLRVDPSTIGYETGKLDKHGNMIYGGMRVISNQQEFLVVFENGSWFLDAIKPTGIIKDFPKWLLSERDVEIIDEGEVKL